MGGLVPNFVGRFLGGSEEGKTKFVFRFIYLFILLYLTGELYSLRVLSNFHLVMTAFTVYFPRNGVTRGGSDL